MSDSQVSLLRQFKENVSDILIPNHTDTILLRFLRAKNFNLKNAEKNLREVEASKKVFGIDTILDTYVKPEVLEKFESTSIMGLAKDGTAIRYVDGGSLDFMGFISSLSCFDLSLYFCHLMEYDMDILRKESRKAGREINEMTYVFDCQGASIQQIAYKSVIEVGLDFFDVMQNYYPDLWRKILFVNVPFFFGKVFAIFKPILKAGVLDKIQMVPKANTSEVLLQYIDEDVLPVFLGGKRVDSRGDPKCSEFIKFGGKVPHHYYLKNRAPLLKPVDPQCTSTLVGPRSVYNHSLVFREAGAKFRATFRTENGSISGSLLFKDFGCDLENPDIPGKNEILKENDEISGVRMLSPVFRCQSHVSREIITAKVTAPGIYVLRFDNTSSWFISRKLILKVEILPPENDFPRN